MPISNHQCGAEIVDGKLVLDDAESFKVSMRRMKPGRKIVTVEDEEAKRSAAANRYLWGPIYGAIEQHTGQRKEDIHDEMCARFTTETIQYTNPKTNEIVELEVVRRTSGMSVLRFHRFVEDVKLFAQEFFEMTFEEAPEDYHTERQRAQARDAAREAREAKRSTAA